MILLATTMTSIGECPRWISDHSNETAPAGVSISASQQVKNRLRCYNQIAVPWQRSCAQQRNPGYCLSKINLWLVNNFSFGGLRAGVCGEVPPGRYRTYMINISEVN